MAAIQQTRCIYSMRSLPNLVIDVRASPVKLRSDQSVLTTLSSYSTTIAVKVSRPSLSSTCLSLRSPRPRLSLSFPSLPLCSLGSMAARLTTSPSTGVRAPKCITSCQLTSHMMSGRDLEETSTLTPSNRTEFCWHDGVSTAARVLLCRYLAQHHSRVLHERHYRPSCELRECR